MTSKHDRKIAGAFGFLSLDIVVPFAGELEMPWVDPHKLQELLKSSLGKYVNDANYYKRATMLCGAVYKSIDENLGVDHRLSILKWISHAYIGSTGDRLLENTWILILAIGCSQKQYGLDQRLFDQLKTLNRAAFDSRLSVESKIEIAKCQPLSAWDTTMCSILDSNAEDIYGRIVLIAALNALVKQWRLQKINSVDDLKAVHEWGLIISSENGMKKDDVLFVGELNG